jgi:hypothetical protein
MHDFEQSHPVDGHGSYSTYTQYSLTHDRLRIAAVSLGLPLHGLGGNHAALCLLGSMPLPCGSKSTSDRTRLCGYQVLHGIDNIQTVSLDICY